VIDIDRTFYPTGQELRKYTLQLIINTRFGTRGFADRLLNGDEIGFPPAPVLNYDSPEWANIVPEVLSGKKFTTLAISEAFAGCDVSGLQTTAVRDGKIGSSQAPRSMS
jgi:hypothetical protein